MSIDTKWTRDQARIILENTKTRIEAEPKSFKVKDQADNVMVTNEKGGDERISLTFYKNRNHRTYLAIGDHWGPVDDKVEESTSFFKKNQPDELIPLIDYFLNINTAKVEFTSMDAIIKCFPETVGREFEKHVLESKDGKEKS